MNLIFFQGDTSNRPIVIEKGYIDELESQINLLKKENEQLSTLNRKLTEDIMAYTYKDTLKEAQYIIEGQYNNLLAPQKYKYLLQESKTLYFM